tara:strand:- start:6721 stop:7194 length:474 start_codon:yes stop_codon:yes gene_type:complete
MIQIEGHDNVATIEQSIILPLRDLYGSFQWEYNYYPLFTLVSQETGKEKTFLPYTMTTTNAQRYLKFGILIMSGNEIPLIGWINLGTKNFPYGLYDLTVRNNNSQFNLNVLLAQNVIWNGLLNLQEDPQNESIQFDEYEETQNQQVYITNEYQDIPD